MSLNPLHTARPGTVEYRRAAHELSVLDTVFAEAPVGLAIVDEIGRFVRVNDSFARLVRTPPSELSGKHLSTLAGSTDPDRARSESSAFLRGTEDLPYDCRVRTREGFVALVLRRRALAIEGRQYDLITATAPDDDTNPLPRSVPVAPSRAEPERSDDKASAQLQAALAEVERANTAKSQFLAQMSHELRTPLNAILGFSEMLRLQMLGPIGVAKYQEYAEAIHDSGAHLLSLINDVLDVSRIEAGKWEPQIEEVDVKGVVSACLRMMQVPAERGQIAMTFAGPQGPLNARADRRGLQQMILNLMSNAVKFTPKGGQVMVALSTEPGLALITVADTGIGIAPDKLQRLGRPFEQVENPLARRHRGTGLGLALTKLIAERLGGSLGIASAEGRGTTATIRLPRTS
ncbi:MAG: PAS domain-containing sensor histidine kinase [Alphaproteobacteria bacterium]|nr:PAS domain-containing sensor histidine kinase [Alphaproteobacteria bacterium]